jgi:hypothetical protein
MTPTSIARPPVPTGSRLQAAAFYAERGWYVFLIHCVRNGRCTCGRTDCSGPGKHPRTGNGLKDASTDPETIRGWWKRWPDANVGIVTGEVSGIVVVDIDPRYQGDESLEKLIAKHDGRIMGGLSSGEGLIWNVRDPISKQEAIREGGRKSGEVIGYQDVVTDAGIEDKRLMVVESEFGSVLKVIGRERNTLSAIIRQSWDTGNLRTLTKNSPATATGAHISIVGHITRAELQRLVTEVDMANGLCNRFLWICVKRSKLLPEGGTLHAVDLDPIVRQVQEAVAFARATGTVCRDGQAIWHEVYPRLSEGKPGLLGAATSRAEAQTVRLATIYAVLDRSPMIRAEYLLAGLAVWTYAEQSATLCANMIETTAS